VVVRKVNGKLETVEGNPNGRQCDAYQKDPATVAGPNHDDRYRGYRKEWTTFMPGMSLDVAERAEVVREG
jgi:hypothetical protein